jgi:hypothetical protein
MAWLLRGEEVLGSLDLVEDRGRRLRGLLGCRRLDDLLLFRPARLPRTFGTRVKVDVACCGSDLTVVGLDQGVGPFRPLFPRPGTRCVLVGEAGWSERVRLAVGDHLDVKE